MKIEVLGSGCSTCDKLYKMVFEVVSETGIDATVTKVTDLKQILGYGVMASPGLVIDGKVMSSGRMPSKPEITRWLQGGK